MATHTIPASSAPFQPLAPVERDTLTKIFFYGVDTYRLPDAVWGKVGGQWRTYSHAEVERIVTAVAAALDARGVTRGDRVALLSENRPEWLFVDYATLGLGAVDVPIYPTLTPPQIAYILADSGTKVVVASTLEQVAKIREIRDRLGAVQLVMAFDRAAAGADVVAFEDLVAEGQRRVDAGEFADFRSRALSIGRDDLATLIYTSGTTGEPKGVMLTHYNIASNVAACKQHGVVRPGPDEVTLSFLPLSHILERMVDYWHWDSGVRIAYAESIEKVADNMLEVRPTVMVSVPRLFEKIYGRVTGATGLRAKLIGWARRVGEAAVEYTLAGRDVPASLRWRYRLADRLVFSKLRARTGGRLHTFISGGAPLSAEIAKFFFAAGLPVYEGYGLTETSPVLTVNKPGAVKLGTVGRPIPGVELRIAPETGEILARGPNIMKGYWNKPEATAEVIEPDGWFHTGDIGEIDADGFLRITDRLKNILVTAGGKNIAPQPIENEATMSPYVSQAVLIADRRPYPVLVVVPDFDNLTAWAQAQGLPTADRKALLKEPAVRALLEREVFARMEKFARFERPKKLLLVAEEFSIEGGTLTPTMKVRRKIVEEKYREEIERLYAEPGPRDEE